jgi:serine/threonine protein kinase
MYEMDGGNPLGRGAYGSVYKCTHRITEIEYAVKIISKAGPCPKKVFLAASESHQIFGLHFPSKHKLPIFLSLDRQFYEILSYR